VSAVCGTYAGYQGHCYRGEKPCGSCRRARNEYMTALRRRRPEMLIQDRARATIRNCRKLHRGDELVTCWYCGHRGHLTVVRGVLVMRHGRSRICRSPR
jgi:hypothetical protein